MHNMAKITVTKDGPYKVEDVPVVDAGGAEIETKPTAFLCRCGQSAKKPFCDGTHSKAGFVG